MAPAEDRQAKALEGVERGVKELVKVMGTMNENLVIAFKYIKQEIEKDQGDFEAGIDSKNQMSIDDLRAASEKAEKERAERAEYENRTGEMWADIDVDHNKVEHLSEFNNPGHRPITFRISHEDNALTESELEQRRISMLGMSAPNWQTGALIKVIDPRSPHFGSTGVVTELHRTCLDLDFGSSVGEYDYYQVALVSNTTVNERTGEGSE